MAAASVPAQGDREGDPSGQDRVSSPRGWLPEQAEGIPKEAASPSKTNISQAPAAFGKLLLGKSHMNHPVSSQ